MRNLPLRPVGSPSWPWPPKVHGVPVEDVPDDLVLYQAHPVASRDRRLGADLDGCVPPDVDRLVKEMGTTAREARS